MFLRFTAPVAAEISGLALMRRLESGRPRGWGSLRVTAELGESRWQTSIFPGDGDTWLLPVKAAVRKSESIAEGDAVTVTIAL